jgi:sugar phosphate isomerase/epimerase
MQLGIFAKTFEGTTPAAILTAVKRAGFQVAQYNLACSGLPSMPAEVPDEALSAVKDAVTATGVQLNALSATYNMIDPDEARREAGHRRLAIVAGAAKSMSIPLLTLCTGSRHPSDQWAHHPLNNSKEAWQDLLTSMARAIEIANQHDLLLGIEPELANVVNSAAKAKLLLQTMQSSRLRIVFDPANLFEATSLVEQRNIITAALDLLAPHMVMVHAKDRTADGHFVAAGKGVLDYGHFFTRLRSSGFAGPLVTHGLSADEAPGVARFLAQQWAAIA